MIGSLWSEILYVPLIVQEAELTIKVEIMHEYLEEQAAHRLTWIVIWLIVAACLVEAVRPSSLNTSKLTDQGEVLARVLFHSIPVKGGDFLLVKGGKMLVNGVRTISS
jgi:hypothetical protein